MKIDTTGIIAPHLEAAKIVKSKPVLNWKVFNGMLPELKARAFTVTGLEGANALQRVRDAIAALPMGANWNEVKADVASELEGVLGEDGAKQRAELLIRVHGFQAFTAADWRDIQSSEDQTHIQYATCEDDRVRPAHEALNGIILPKDDPFWANHTPPWDWGCRCSIIGMNVDQVNNQREKDKSLPVDEQLVLDPTDAAMARGGALQTGAGVEDVRSPVQKKEKGAWVWHPDNLTMPVKELKSRYDPVVWAEFESWAKNQTTIDKDGHPKTLWKWLSESEYL